LKDEACDDIGFAEPIQIAVLSESHDGMAALSGAASLEWLRAKRTGKSSFVFFEG